MKKTTLVLICFIIATFSNYAQTESKKTKDKIVTFGFRTGYEFQTSESNLNYQLKLPYIGILSDISLSKKWSFQLELNLRSEKREERFSNDFKQSYNELYLTGPILLKYHITNDFKIYTGTQVLSASLINDISGLKKWNGIIGAEYNLSGKLFIEACFRHGFEERKSTNNFRDNRISFGIGYKF
nr:outer membrane beta-barrel protein [uncultured Psychroserpens sp.]